MLQKVLLTSIAVLWYGCQPNTWIAQQNNGNVFGTTYTIKYITHQQIDYQKEIDSVLQAVNRSLSTYISDSDISKINRGDTTLIIDSMFREVFEISGKVYQASHGHFDPTVGTLANAWGFGPRAPTPLDSTKVDSLLQYVGWNKVQLHADNTVTKAHSAIQFDFNAVAKGYAIDRLGALLNAKGVTHYLIEVGGEVLAKGKNVISKQPWTVGIDDPQSTTHRQLKVIVFLQDKALASSGNYRKFRIDPETGIKYGHTLNPKTGYPKKSNVLAASVVSSSCAMADAYATAFMAMDLDVSQRVLEQQNQLEAYIVYLDEQGATQTLITPGFAALVKSK